MSHGRLKRARNWKRWIRPKNTYSSPGLLYSDVAGCGTVFKLDISGNESVLHSFNGSDGADSYTVLIMDSAGNLYGTTVVGGTGTCNSGFGSGCGTVFKLDTTGNETVLHSFTGGSDGIGPFGGLVMDAAGNLYGTTTWGGNGTCNFGIPGCGTIFKLDSSANETVLYSFANSGGDGVLPNGPLIMDAVGNLYGTTAGGGASGAGTVFKFDTSGKETVLYSFKGGADGVNPGAGLIMDKIGNLYGTTSRGGAFSNCAGGSGGCGAVFKLDTSGNETVLHSFPASPSDGLFPFAALIMDAAGNLYGTTLEGGASNDGTVFKLDTSGNETVLHSVNALSSQGIVNGGQANSLLAQLQHAITLMNAGKNAGAIGNLDSFISEVNDLLNSGVLNPSQAASLVSAAQSVISSLQ